MVLSMLRMGFRLDDLRTMPLTTCAHFIDVHNELAGSSMEPGPREATQADIQSMLA